MDGLKKKFREKLVELEKKVTIMETIFIRIQYNRAIIPKIIIATAFIDS